LPIRRSFAESGNRKECDAQRVANIQSGLGPMRGCGDRQSENETRPRLHLKEPKKPTARFVAPLDAQLSIARIVASLHRAPNDVKAKAKGP
jgi:hypothetical protein